MGNCVCMYMYICTHVCKCVCIRICMYACVCVNVYVSVRVNIFLMYSCKVRSMNINCCNLNINWWNININWCNMNIAVRNSHGFVSGRTWNWTFRSGENDCAHSNLILSDHCWFWFQMHRTVTYSNQIWSNHIWSSSF